MKQLVIASFLLLFSFAVGARQITGRVTDSYTGQGIPGATIAAPSGFATITSDSGYFQLPASVIRAIMAMKVKKLVVSSIGYITKEVDASTENFRITLDRINLFLSPVEITATRAADESPFTKTEISKSDISAGNLGTDLPFLLQHTPSVIVNSDAGNGIGYTGIRIRGSDATRINMTINGIPYNDAESQGLFFVNLPDLASSLQSIQIQRGVGTSTNGAGAFGATINFSTHENNLSPYAEISNSIGSFHTRKHTVKAGSGLINDHFTFDARLSSIKSDGYIDRAFSNLQSFYVSGAWLNASTSVRMNVFSGREKTYQAWYGIPESDLLNNRTRNYAGTEKSGAPYENETDNYQQDHYQLFLNHEFSKHLAFNTAFFLTKGAGYYEQYKADEGYTDYGLPVRVTGNDTVATTDLIRQLWLENDFYGQVLSLQYKSGNHRLTAGGGWNRYNGKHFGNIIWTENGIQNYPYKWYDLGATKKDINGYVKYQFNIAPSWFLFGDIQYRNVKYTLNGFRNNPAIRISNNYRFINPKGGITYYNNGLKAYLSYARASKEPNRDDFEAGVEQQPRPEKLHDLELGLEKKRTKYSWGITAYHMYYRDQLVLTGMINDVGAYTRTNIPQSERSGIELQGNLFFSNWLQAGGNLTLSRNRIRTFTGWVDDWDNGGQKSTTYQSTPISYSPAITGAASVTVRPVERLSISLLPKYVSAQYLDNTGNENRKLDAYFVQDARIQYSISKKLINEIHCTLLISNVFNTRYEPNGYTYGYLYNGAERSDNYYFPMAGINFLLGLKLKF